MIKEIKEGFMIMCVILFLLAGGFSVVLTSKYVFDKLEVMHLKSLKEVNYEPNTK